ncbi:hypothetical protein EMIT0324P_170003 [Pseudomonas chlororaphis]
MLTTYFGNNPNHTTLKLRQQYLSTINWRAHLETAGSKVSPYHSSMFSCSGWRGSRHRLV